MDALRDCDACVLVLPCGSSAHLELGWACGAGKRTAVLFPHGIQLPSPKDFGQGHSLASYTACPECGDLDGCHLPGRLQHIEPELMSKCADEILINVDELRESRADLDAIVARHLTSNLVVTVGMSVSDMLGEVDR